MSDDELTIPPPVTQRSRSTTRRANDSHTSSVRRPTNASKTSSVGGRPAASAQTSSYRTGTSSVNASRTSLRSRVVASLKRHDSEESGISDSDLSSEDDADDGARPSGLTNLVQDLQEASNSVIHRHSHDEAVKHRLREKKRQLKARRRRESIDPQPIDEEHESALRRAGEEARDHFGQHRRRRRRDEAVRQHHKPPTGLDTVPEAERPYRTQSGSRRSTSSAPSSSSQHPPNGDGDGNFGPPVNEVPQDNDAPAAHPRDRFSKFDQNLNEPFLPPTAQEKHSLPARLVAPLWDKLTGYERPSAVGMNAATPGTGSVDDNRNSMAAVTALLTTTGNLVGVASPTLAGIGPVWDEQGRSKRRIARYGRTEAVPDTEAQEQLAHDYERKRALKRRHERAARRETLRNQREQQSNASSESDSSLRSPRNARSRKLTGNKSDQSDSSIPPEVRDFGASKAAGISDGRETAAGTSNGRDKDKEWAEADGDHVLNKEGEGSKFKEDGHKAPPPQEETLPEGGSSEAESTTEGMSDDTSLADGEAPDLEKGTQNAGYVGWIGSKRGERKQQEIYITRHRSTHAQSRDFVVRLANALMLFGAPTHRIEGQLESAARILELDAHFFYLPSIMVMSFSKPELETSETAFLRCGADLDVQSLRKVHVVSRAVLHDHISTEEGARRLKRITTAPPRHAVWQRILIIASCSFFASSVVFNGSFIDMWASAILGGLMGTCQHTLAAWNPLFSNCFEIAMAFVISFLAKALAASGYFCYASLTSSGIVMILPGYVLLNATLELASKVVVPGSIRLVSGVLLSLFLGTGISLGSKLYVLIDPSGGRMSSTSSADSNSGQVVCAKTGDEPWYQQDITPWVLFVTLPGFAISLALWTKARLKTRQTAATLVIACLSYASYYFAKQALADEPEVSSAIGAGVVGFLGALWSRVARGTAFTTQSAAILLLVPNGLAAAGGIVMSSSSGTQSFEEGAQVALRQIQTSVGITIGLFVASLVTYLGSRKKRGTILSY